MQVEESEWKEDRQVSKLTETSPRTAEDGPTEKERERRLECGATGVHPQITSGFVARDS